MWNNKVLLPRKRTVPSHSNKTNKGLEVRACRAPEGWRSKVNSSYAFRR